MSDDTRKDRLLAAAACLVLAAMLGGLAAWLAIGIGAAEADHDRFGHVPRADPQVLGVALMLLAGVLGTAALVLVGLAVWMLIVRHGTGRAHR